MEKSYPINIDNWEYFCSHSRWYPDIFLDIIKPASGGLNLHLDQRIYLRGMLRFVSFNGVFPRGYGKTFDEVLAAILCCVFYPNMTIALTAQTKESAASLVVDKYDEILRFYPLLGKEIMKYNASKNMVKVKFWNGAELDILANAQSSKGQRRRRINVEESAQVDADLFSDCIEPIVVVPRLCSGKYTIVDPEELNGQINYFTTSWYKGTDEYQRSVDVCKEMIELKGKLMLGSSWFLATWYGRGLTKIQILEKKKTASPTFFAMNYESKWVGAVDGCLVSINKLSECRNLTTPFLHNEDGTEEVYLGVDVARSQNTSNNQSSVAAIRVTRNKNGRVKTLEVGNTINISNTKNFTAQAIEVKRLKRIYNAAMVIVDGNGLGSGLVDELLKEQDDPITGEVYQCWNTINTDNEPENQDYETCLFDMKAQGNQSKVVTHFIDAVDGGKLRMLVAKNDNEFTQKEMDSYKTKVLPFVQTNFMFEEIANLKLKETSKGISVERTVAKMNKDRFSSLAYAIFYIMEFCNNIDSEKESYSDTLMSYLYI